MATKTKGNVEFDSLTTITEEKESGYNGPMVDIFLPALEDQGQGGMKVDQYEHVTIANERGEKCYKVLRGEHVSVPVPVFVVLKERYPKL
jgi:hypothetical protein